MDKERGFGWMAGMVVLIGLLCLIGFLIWSRAVYDRRLDKRYPDESG